MKWSVTAGILLLSMSGYWACRKYPVQSRMPLSAAQLVRWENTVDTVAATTLLKDEKGRITNMETALEKNTFTYQGDSLLLEEFSKEEGRIVYRFFGKLHLSGRLTEGMAIAAYGKEDIDTVLHRFQYDEAGFLVKEYRHYTQGGDYSIVYSYRNGDMVRIETWYNNELYNTKELDYHASVNNLTGMEEYKFRSNVNNLAGQTSRHLVSSVTSTGRNGKLNYAYQYEYEAAGDGLSLKLTSKKGKKIQAVTTYHYAPRA